MVWKKKEKPREAAPAQIAAARNPAGGALTQLGQTVTVEGSIHADEDVLIAGTVRGELHADKRVTITESGSFEDEIHCESIVISGRVKGNIHARETITIEQTGHLRGDITTKVLTNQPGGFFEGYSHMLDGKTPSTTAAKNSATKDQSSKPADVANTGNGDETSNTKETPSSGKVDKKGKKA